MACYISSRENRFFVKTEPGFGEAAAPAAGDRITALKLEIREEALRPERRDKTGGRTYPGVPNSVKRNVEFAVETYLTSWENPGAAPAAAALWSSALGGSPVIQGGAAITDVTDTTVTFSGAHGLAVGSGIGIGNELRFVVGIPGANQVLLNAPLTGAVPAGSATRTTASVGLATTLKSFSLWDYWTPAGMVQRGLLGGVADEATVDVNGDWHQFRFAGPAKKLIDSTTFEAGTAGLTAFPGEPDTAGFDYAVVPGHLGEVWAGVSPNKLLTLAEAKLRVKNGVEFGNQYFGSGEAVCVSAGQREVLVEFEIFATDAADVMGLYQAARNRTPVPVMFQLGQQTGQMFGFYLPSVVLTTPEFDDRETRLRWKFTGRAQGNYNDELFVAFA